MKILITGATGLVGRFLGIELVRQGHNLVVVSRNAKSARQQCPFPCEVIEADLIQGPLGSDQVSAIDGVIHLMGESIATGFWTDSKKKKLEDSRILSTQNLALSFKGHKLDFFISASAIGFYGDRGEEALTEVSSPGDDYLAQLCQRWEKSADEFTSIANRLVKLRIGLVLTRQGGLLGELTPVFQKGLGGKLGSGQHWMSWIHRDDLVRAIAFIVKQPSAQGVINAVAPEPVRNDEFTNQFKSQLGRSAFFPVPVPMLKLIFGEKGSMLVASQKVSSEKLQQLGFRFQFCHLAEALKHEFEFTSQGEELFEAWQYIEQPLARVFPFFSDSSNLEKITPPSLNFKIEKVSTPDIQQGTLIDYRLKIRGVPVSLKTEIDSWDPPRQFVDNQLEGPYALWHHTHQFESLGTGTLMTDRVRYRLPLGTIGKLGGLWMVQNEVAGIFKYRRQVIEDIFK